MSSLLMFNRVYRLEIQSVTLVFSPQLCELLNLFRFKFKNMYGNIILFAQDFVFLPSYPKMLSYNFSAFYLKEM
jgi:hypothetical protein